MAAFDKDVPGRQEGGCGDVIFGHCPHVLSVPGESGQLALMPCIPFTCYSADLCLRSP